eukprot:1538516-Rhodomonas_salina.5
MPPGRSHTGSGFEPSMPSSELQKLRFVSTDAGNAAICGGSFTVTTLTVLVDMLTFWRGNADSEESLSEMG